MIKMNKSRLFDKLNNDIFPFVQKPTRYLGIEQGISKKDIKKMPVKYALAFPDFYELGMSHIGMGIIYDILNSKDYIACERVYLPYPDMSSKLKENKIPLFSLESFEDIKEFDIVGFSLQYELSYTNILFMLESSDIPIFSKDRNFSHPLVGAGGPCAFNPLPLNDFIDFFIIGDGETAAVSVCDAVLKAKNDLKNGLVAEKDYRDYVKAGLVKIRGVYVPGYSKNVKKAICYDLNLMGYVKKNIVPLIETVHNRLSVEIARGCSSGCRFCQAGYIYRPVRERKKETVVEIIKQGIGDTGLGEISLSSLSTGDYSDINGLLDELSYLSEDKQVSMSFPSMRIGSLSEKILQKTAEVKKTNFTLAPEAGTQRLRDIINKNISEYDLLKEVENLSKRGFKSLKLYFMIGLPYERISDIDGIKDLILKIKKVSKGLNITVNINNFVPKPHTPFQWHPMNKASELNFKINYLKKSLRPINVNLRYQDPKVSFIEGLISRGDEFISKIIYKAYKFGAVYDSEMKLFNFDAWIKALNSFDNISGGGILNRYLYDEKDLNDALPWDFIDILVKKDYLKAEFEKAYKQNTISIYNFSSDIITGGVGGIEKQSEEEGLSTENCRKVCHLCGVCDFEEISPVYSSKTENVKMHKKQKNDGDIDIIAAGKELCEKNNGDIINILNTENTINDKADQAASKLLIRYSKRGVIRYLGHLETAKILLRVFRIAKLSIAYKESRFSPKPKISYSNPIPFMSESDNLYLTIKIKNKPVGKADALKDLINYYLPDGLKILDITEVEAGFKI